MAICEPRNFCQKGSNSDNVFSCISLSFVFVLITLFFIVDEGRGDYIITGHYRSASKCILNGFLQVG